MSQLAWAILALILALMVHLVEEIQTGFRRKFPLGEIPRIVFVSLNIALYLYCLATFLLAAFDRPLARPLAWFFAGAMLLNSLGHIGLMIPRKAYFPGGISAFLLLPLSVILMVVLWLGP